MALILEEKFLSFIKDHQLLSNGDHVLVGVSGGADSVCLLLLLSEVKEQYQLTIGVSHINHGIREGDADRDEAFVKDLCERLKVDHFYSHHFDVKALARDEKKSLEDMGRSVRYRTFYNLMKEHGYQKLFVAHHGDDLVETMLFRIARGTSVAGLTAMKPIADFDMSYDLWDGYKKKIVRPLLSFEKEEILSYLKEKGQDYCEDVTNLDDKYKRNQIRNNVLPELKLVNENTVKHFYELSENADKYRTYFLLERDKVVKELLCPVEGEEKGFSIPVDKLKEKPQLMIEEILLHALKEVAGSEKDLKRLHVNDMMSVLDGDNGKRISLPYGVSLYKEYDKLYICKNRDTLKTDIVIDKNTILENITGTIPLAKGVLNYRLIDKGDDLEISYDRYKKMMDFDRLDDRLFIRSIREKDEMVIDQDGHRKKVARIFIDEKIPKRLREEQMLFTSRDEVYLIIGNRMSESVKIKEETKKVLVLQYDE